MIAVIGDDRADADPAVGDVLVNLGANGARVLHHLNADEDQRDENGHAAGETADRGDVG